MLFGGSGGPGTMMTARLQSNYFDRGYLRVCTQSQHEFKTNDSEFGCDLANLDRAAQWLVVGTDNF